MTVSSGNWQGTHAAGFFNRRLFGIHLDTIYEVFETSWTTIASGYSDASFFIQKDGHMYTVLGNRLTRVTITSTTTRKQILGPFHLDNLHTMVSTDGHLFCTVGGRWLKIAPGNGCGETLSGEGNTTAAAAYLRRIYAINQDGNIDLVDTRNGETLKTFNSSGLFKGSHGVVEYNEMLYAIGKNGRFYEISPCTGKATAKGCFSNWQVDGVMTAASW